MIDRLSVAASIAIHMGLAILLAMVAISAPVLSVPQNGMEIEIVDFEHAMPNVQPIVASLPQSSQLSENVTETQPNVVPVADQTSQIATESVQPQRLSRQSPQFRPVAPTLGPAPVGQVDVSGEQLRDLAQPVAVKRSPPSSDVSAANERRLDTSAISRSLGSTNDRASRSRLNSAAIGSAIGQAAPMGIPGLTIRQRADLAGMVRSQVIPCWNPPASNDPGGASVTLRFRLDRRGHVVGQPSVSGARGRSERNAAYINLLANSGRRAILLCAPLELPPELYEAWEQVEVEFDPRDL